MVKNCKKMVKVKGVVQKYEWKNMSCFSSGIMAVNCKLANCVQMPSLCRLPHSDRSAGRKCANLGAQRKCEPGPAVEIVAVG